MDLAAEPVNVLSICSGGAGLDLGFRLAIPTARTVCFVEWEAFACAELLRRMEEGELDAAPLWSDLRTFDGKPWRGKVDAIIGGIPCQPWSVAGARRGQDDSRHLWPQARRLVEEIRPAIMFLENVPGMLSIRGGADAIVGELEALGYSVEAGCFTASEVGASHKRERLFILGIADDSERRPDGSADGRGPGRKGKRPGASIGHVGDAERAGTGSGAGGSVADAAGRGLGGVRQPSRADGQPDGRDEGLVHAGSDGRGEREPGARPDRGTAVGETGGGSGGLTEAEIYGDFKFDGSDEFALAWIDGIGEIEETGSIGQSAGKAPCQRKQNKRAEPVESVSIPLFPPGPGDRDAWRRILDRFPHLAPASPQSHLRLLADELATDRARLLRLLGNGVVPLCAAYALCWLWLALVGEDESGVA